MELIHIGLVSSCEEQADRFFGEVLGLEKTRRSNLSKELAVELFGAETGCEIVYYGGEGAGKDNVNLVFEVFLAGRSESTPKKISHSCLMVDDRAAVVARCRDRGFSVREARKADYVVVFVEDGDGNLFELKEAH